MDVVLRLLFFLLLSEGQSHLFTETSQSFNENKNGSREECKDHLFYQMPELPRVTETKIKFHTLFTWISTGMVGFHYPSNH